MRAPTSQRTLARMAGLAAVAALGLTACGGGTTTSDTTADGASGDGDGAKIITAAVGYDTDNYDPGTTTSALALKGLGLATDAQRVLLYADHGLDLYGSALLTTRDYARANPDALRMDEDAVAFIKEFVGSGKPVAAICHAPWTLVEADVVRGKRLTSWPSLQTDIRNAGGEWVDEEVVTSDNLITSRNPDDIPAFNKAVVAALAG